MVVVDGAADKLVTEQHGHLEVGLLGCHLRRHRSPEGAASENHHLQFPPTMRSHKEDSKRPW
jgi:hypothetical protein